MSQNPQDEQFHPDKKPVHLASHLQNESCISAIIRNHHMTLKASKLSLRVCLVGLLSLSGETVAQPRNNIGDFQNPKLRIDEKSWCLDV
jgi:hypothetical protein